MGKSETDVRVWVVRAGRHGDEEALALERKVAIVGFRTPDLATAKSFDELLAKERSRHPDSPQRAAAYARQLWALKDLMREGDVVVMPMKTRQNRLALGRCTGPYRALTIDGETRHARPVEWMRLDVPRTELGDDLLRSLGALLTVFEVRRNDAARRFLALLDGQPDPGFAGESTPYVERPRRAEPAAETMADEACDEPAAPAALDLERIAADEITTYIRQRFPGHDLSRLVDGILRAQGFHTYLSPPGPDGGIDVLAARGGLGLDPPYLAVQVKARQATSDVTELRELVGAMDTFKANQGLFVSWSGYTRAAEQFARQQYFKLRLWSAEDLVQALFETYENLDPELQAELPLKRTWVLVHDDAG